LFWRNTYRFFRRFAEPYLFTDEKVNFVLRKMKKTRRKIIFLRVFEVFFLFLRLFFEVFRALFALLRVLLSGISLCVVRMPFFLAFLWILPSRRSFGTRGKDLSAEDLTFFRYFLVSIANCSFCLATEKPCNVAA